jgi:hypothetical protein
MLNHLDRSRASLVDQKEGGLGKALALLKVALDELQIDGLTSPQIAKVLTDKFRWRVTRQAITQALDAAGPMVDSMPAPRGARAYRLMSAGEEWLAKGGSSNEEQASRESVRPRKSNRRTRKASAKKTPGKANGTKTPAKKTSRRTAAGRTGPKTSTDALIKAGWFSTGRTISDIREQLERDHALRFKATDLSPALTRLLREGRLKRSKNSEGQYEYIAPSP